MRFAVPPREEWLGAPPRGDVVLAVLPFRWSIGGYRRGAPTLFAFQRRLELPGLGLRLAALASDGRMWGLSSHQGNDLLDDPAAVEMLRDKGVLIPPDFV